MDTASDLRAEGKRRSLTAGDRDPDPKPLGTTPSAGQEAKAAGVAHDLNNVLTIVLVNLERLQRQTLDEAGRRELSRAMWGAQQAARLCNGAQPVTQRKADVTDIIDLKRVVEEFLGMVGEVVGDGIAVKLRLASQPLPVRLSVGGLELALLNLVRNAIDAMPGNGQLCIDTARASMGDGASTEAVEVAVTDTGSGMSVHAASRATEAFFTTKEPGHGTGLGLWMVQQFVTGANGEVIIETEEGGGTTVRLRFPLAVAGPALKLASAATSDPQRRRNQRPRYLGWSQSNGGGKAAGE